MRGRTALAVAGCTLLLAAAAAPLQGQTGSLNGRCMNANASDQARAFCGLIAEAAEITQPRMAVALAGGNPVPGTASTLGMRLGAMPRISLAFRGTVANTTLPQILDRNATDDVDFLIPVGSIDASIGVLQGLSIFPTVGGLGSIDMLASLGFAAPPEGEGFDGSPISWGLGAKLGILRESFTAPGLSASVMYRSVGDVHYGDEDLVEDDAYFALDGMHGWSLRGVVGKRLFTLGASAGVGYDRYDSDVTIRLRDGLLGLGEVEITEDSFRSDRITAFGNLAWTIVILSVIGEVGWQQGSESIGTSAGSGLAEKAGYYGSLAVRVAL